MGISPETVVEIAATASGEIVVARIVTPSGLVEADRRALEIAETLQFEPESKGEIAWGKIIFVWQTVPVEKKAAP